MARWWSQKYQLPRNHPLFREAVPEELWCEFFEDQIEAYRLARKAEDEVDVELEDVRYEDVFPLDTDEKGEPREAAGLLQKLMQERPGEDMGTLLEEARRLAELAKQLDEDESEE